MMPRKPFKELSKSQRNRRLKHVAYDESLSTSPQQSSPSDSNQSKDKTTPDIIICDTQNVSDQTINTDKDIPGDTAITEDAFCDSIVVTNVTDNVILTENRELRDNHDSILLNKTPDITDAKINLQHKLAQWQCQYNISQAACGALLKILIDVDSVEECNNLPKDPRTLLNTPKNTNIRSVPPGEYFHYGLQQGLAEQLRIIDVNNLSTNILINVHIDGLPIAKSSKRQLYPILAEIFPKIASPFVIGIYHGFEKPANCNEYLEDFINEYKDLHTNGFQYSNKKFYVTMRAVIWDSPARAFVKNTKGHTGYYGCSKCHL